VAASSSPLLRPSAYLDYESPNVQAFVREVTEGATTDRERASRLFLAVRDRIRYDPYQVDLSPGGLTASTTLERGAAFCVPKAILLAAVYRAVGLPTRLGFVDVTNHLATPRLIEVLRTRVFAFHGYVEVELDGAKRKVTPAFDAKLCAKFGVAPLEFDGSADAMLQPFNGEGRAFLEYLEDRGIWDDFPHEEMIRVWKLHYGHFFEPLAETALPSSD
jgi:transglutaminase-like putative cysteine protease